MRTAGSQVVALVIAGGVLYSVGAVVYATKRPKLSLKYFGFHELFHAFTIAAFLCHYIAIAITVAKIG
jgi:hemolysin III